MTTNKFHKNLPCEVMIEVEPKCNLNCRFCFNKIAFAKYGRSLKPFSDRYVKKIISGIAKAGIKIVRFTGGEPLLRADIFELMRYAKNKGLKVFLNTNGTLITSANIKNFKGVVDNILISIENYKDEKIITGKRNTLCQKINAIRLLKKNKIPVVRVGTVAIRENILNFEKLARLIFRLPADSWELYRPISAGKESITGKEVNLLADKLIKIRRKTGKKVFIANALPFCAVKDMDKIDSVSRGAIFDDGHSRMVVDPRGFVKPHYFINKNLGDPLDILSCWNHPFMKRVRNLEYLPRICLSCHFRLKCRGGSRYEAKNIYGSYYAMDPLARPARRVCTIKVLS